VGISGISTASGHGGRPGKGQPQPPAHTHSHTQTELDTRLEALKASPECATAWPEFYDAMDTDAWEELSLDDQTEVG